MKCFEVKLTAPDSLFDPGGAGSSQEVFVPRDGLQVSLRAADQDVRDQPGLPGSGQVIGTPLLSTSCDYRVPFQVLIPGTQTVFMLTSLFAASFKSDAKIS